jgi:hypothetical protein
LCHNLFEVGRQAQRAGPEGDALFAFYGSQLPVVGICVRGGDEAFEEGMRLVRLP